MRVTDPCSVAVHCSGLPATGVQLVHWYDVGLFVHAADNVSVVFTDGDLELGEIEQNGVGELEGGGKLEGGGGAEFPLVRQSTATPDFPLDPALLLATSA